MNMAEEEKKVEERQGCQHEDKNSICFKCKRQYTCDEAQDAEVFRTEVCVQGPGNPNGFEEMGK